MSSSSFVSSFLFMCVCLSEVQSFSLCGNVVGGDSVYSVWECCREGILCGNVVGGDSVWECCRRGFCVGMLSEGILCGNVVGEDSVWEYCRRGFCEVKVLPRTYKEGGKEEEEEEEEEETVSGVLSTHPM